MRSVGAFITCPSRPAIHPAIDATHRLMLAVAGRASHNEGSQSGHSFFMLQKPALASFPLRCLALLSFALPAWAQDAAPQALSFWAMLQSAGLAILPIIGLSILALAVVLERLIRCRRDRVVPESLARAVKSAWQNNDHAGIEQRLKQDTSVLGKALSRMHAQRHRGARDALEAAGDVASIGLREHQQRVYPLAVTATVAPIIGLLGTVVGMIEAFHVIAFAGMGDPTLLAGGISKALVNTAAGLCVALPALMAYHFFKHRIARFGLATEHTLQDLAASCMEGKPDAH
jgi:biopolymer transport protein ExbB